MPVAKGSVEGTPVNVLRDTGCSTIVVRRSLVSDDKLTGQEEQCILIDGTVRYTELRKWMKLEVNLCNQSLNPNISIPETSGHR